MRLCHLFRLLPLTLFAGVGELSRKPSIEDSLVDGTSHLRVALKHEEDLQITGERCETWRRFGNNPFVELMQCLIVVLVTFPHLQASVELPN